MKRIAVLVSGGGTNLQALMEAQKSGVLHSGRIVLVVSNRADAFALSRARAAGIPTLTVEEKSRGALSDKLARALREADIDLVILAGFTAILTPRFIRAFAGRILNVHPSLLPRYGGKGYYGLRVHEAVLAAGEPVTGASVHFVTEGVDEGPLVAQKEVPVKPDDTPQSLQRRVMEEAEWLLLPQAAEDFCAGTLTKGAKV